MRRDILKLLNDLKDNLHKIQKMDYTELKEKVNVIEERYKDLDENIVLNMVDIKPALNIIGDITNEVVNLPEHDIWLIEHIYNNMSFLMKHGYGGTIENAFEDSKPYDDDIKYQVNNLGEILENIKLKYNATERTGDNQA